MFHATLTGNDLHIARAYASTGTPIGTRTPIIAGEFYFDVTTRTLWVAKSLSNTSWERSYQIALDELDWQESVKGFWDVAADGIPQNPELGDKWIASSYP